MSHLPRSRPEVPFQGYPAYGALHEILIDTHLLDFFAKFSEISKSVLFNDDEPGGAADPVLPIQPEGIIDPIPHIQPDADFEPIQLGPDQARGPRFDSRRYYRLFDPEKMGVAVVEMLPLQRAARAMRRVFEGQDFGAVTQDARNIIDRGRQVRYPSLTFNSVIGVGKTTRPVAGKATIRQKLALVADVTKNEETHEKLDLENQVLTRELQKRLKQFTLPSDYIKHLTFVAVKKAVDPDALSEIIQRTNAHLREQPLHVELEQELVFRFGSQRKR